MKKLAYIMFFIVIGQLLSGQQLPIYSQYLYNKFLINPAVAGSDGYTSINMTAREQWTGLNGAPETFSLSLQGRFLKKGYTLKTKRNNIQIFRPKTDAKVGLGGSVFSNRSGLIQRTGFQFAFSYHLWLRNSTQLSLGLSLTGYHFRINEKGLLLEDPNEPVLNDILMHGIFVPDATFGIYLLNRKYNIGFSADQLFGAAAKIGNDAYADYKMSRHFYLFGSYNLQGISNFEFSPAVLIKISEQLKPQADIGLNLNYKQAIWAGLSYRTSEAIIVNIGAKFTKMFVGYAYDFSLQEIQRITYGTHEINLAWKFGDSARKYRWLNRY